MSKNIEIKARYSDLTRAETLARQLGSTFSGTDHQIDTFFIVPNGRLKLRESSLSGNFLILYLRPDQEKAKDSRYVLLPVQEVVETKELLSEMFGIRLIVKKTRRIYRFANVRIHLDEVENLGNFLEFEAVIDANNHEAESRKRLEELLQKFGIKEDQLIAVAYADLLAAQNKS